MNVKFVQNSIYRKFPDALNYSYLYPNVIMTPLALFLWRENAVSNVISCSFIFHQRLTLVFIL